MEPAPQPPPIEPVIVALGSNLEPAHHLTRALELLRGRIEVRAVSRLYETVPVGAPGTPPFLNAALSAATRLAPRALKHELLRPLEAELGRVRSDDKNAPRTLDLDLVLYGALILEDPVHGLRLPDPEILLRAHLALPLADVAPEMRHPVTGETLSAVAARFDGAPGVRVIPAEEVPWVSGKASSPAAETSRRSRRERR